VAQPSKGDDWALLSEGSEQPGQYFKWGWAADGAATTVWRVEGGVDGLPTHKQRLLEAWGRAPSSSGGDVLGVAFAAQEGTLGGGEPAAVVVCAYYQRALPQEVLAWFRAAFPRRLIEVGHV
jgi:hypothetical protein